MNLVKDSWRCSVIGVLILVGHQTMGRMLCEPRSQTLRSDHQGFGISLYRYSEWAAPLHSGQLLALHMSLPLTLDDVSEVPMLRFHLDCLRLLSQGLDYMLKISLLI